MSYNVHLLTLSRVPWPPKHKPPQRHNWTWENWWSLLKTHDHKCSNLDFLVLFLSSELTLLTVTLVSRFYSSLFFQYLRRKHFFFLSPSSLCLSVSILIYLRSLFHLLPWSCHPFRTCLPLCIFYWYINLAEQNYKAF